MRVSIIANLDMETFGAGPNYIRELLGGADQHPFSVNDTSESGATFRLIVPNSLAAIELACEVSALRSLPTMLVVWDELEFLALGARSVTQWRQWRRALLSYKELLRECDVCLAMTERMALRLRGHGLRAPTFVAPYSASSALWEIGDQNLAHGRQGPRESFLLAGSGYSWREINEMCAALDGSSHKLVVAGRTSRLVRRSDSLNFMVHGQEERLGRLSGQFVASYIPYWRAGLKSRFVQSAFPSKLSTSVAVGLPILYHGPADGSPCTLLRDDRMGWHLERVGSSELASIVEEVSSSSFLESFSDVRETLRAGPYGPGGLWRCFESAKNVLFEL